MNILFLHKNFPAQFKYLIWSLTTIPNVNVFFITEDKESEMNGVKKIVSTPAPKQSGKLDSYLEFYEDILTHARGAAKAAQELKASGFKPDLIYSFNYWGVGMFMKDIFPDVPQISYCEWFYNPKGADIGFDGKPHSDEYYSQLRCHNSHMLVDLYSCDAAISPTQWQKQQFPKEFHDKIKVLHDGIATDMCIPDKDAKFDIALVEARNLEICHCEEGQSPDAAIQKKEFTAKDEVITYATRGMEPYRGFPQFMEAAEKLLKKRPNAHIVIAGSENVYYGEKLEKTYKEIMLKKLNLDMNRIHFVGVLDYAEFIKLFQISSVHVYLTYPFILSWSILEAMSCGCCVVGSNTAPVREVIQDNYNGLLADFFDVNQLVEKIEYALDNKEKMEEIRKNARQTIVERYDIKTILPQHIEYLNKLVRK